MDTVHAFKTITIGDPNVGKTALQHYLVENRYVEMYPCGISVEFYCKRTIKDGRDIKLQFWDTCGQERFRSITRSYYRNSSVVLLVFDLTCTKSLYNLNEWLEQVKEHCKATPIIVVGNKLDLEQPENSFDIIKAEAQYFASSNDLPYYEVSSRNGENINTLLDSIINLCVLPPLPPNTPVPSNSNSTRNYLCLMGILGLLGLGINMQFNLW